MKQSLLESVGILLLRRGYTVKTLTRTCFDVIARKGSSILVIKILHDANAITLEYVEAMKKLSSYLSAAPLVIAEKAHAALQNNIVYSRFGVHTLTVSTFERALDKKMPFVLRTKAGLIVQIAGDRLHQAREQQGYSLGALSRRVGVSKQMITRYEQGSDVSVTNARILQDVFGPRVFRQINILSVQQPQQDKSQSTIVQKYASLGFDASDAKKVPFDVVARKEKEIIFTEVGDKSHPQLDSLARLIDADNLVIFSKKKPKEKPALSRKEFLDFESAKELIKFVKEFE